MKGGVSIPLDQPEYIGDGLSSVEAAIDAALEALDFIGEGVDYINVYDDHRHIPAPLVDLVSEEDLPEKYREDYKTYSQYVKKNVTA